jgi:hypothetical protein
MLPPEMRQGWHSLQTTTQNKARIERRWDLLPRTAPYFLATVRSARVSSLMGQEQLETGGSRPPLSLL